MMEILICPVKSAVETAGKLEVKLQRSSILAHFQVHPWDTGLKPWAKVENQNIKFTVLPSFSSTSDFLPFF